VYFDLRCYIYNVFRIAKLGLFRNIERSPATQTADISPKQLQQAGEYTNQFKEEIEMGLDVGIRNGVPANKMTRDLKQYLRHPDKLFRRVRDEHGQLQLSKAAKAYHPGRGVYRSSYKNARRLTATETNMAYRTADYERWQQLDFVVGIKIEPSVNNHETDICDDLAGKYPKDFKWTGWHPHCRCHALTILKTEKELDADTERILNGEEPSLESVNQITALPKKFTEWASDNEERINGAKSAPYFLKDNATTVFCREDMKQFRPMVYNILSQDKNYKDVAYDRVSGGLKATHINHNFNKKGGIYELAVQNIGYKNGHSVILGDEPQNAFGRRSLEGLWNGLPFEAAGAETGTANNIRNALKHCASKPGVEVAVIYFPNGVNIEHLRKGLAKYNGLSNSNDGQWEQFKQIVFLSENGFISV
jgi:hypothetical protein